MFFVGITMVLVCVLVSFYLSGGNPAVLLEVYEFAIIFGSACGALIIGNPMSIITKLFKSLGEVVKGKMHSKTDYVELLSSLFLLCKLAKIKGNIKLESHIESPHSSTILSQYPSVIADSEALSLICDTLRLVTIGITSVHQIEEFMEIAIGTFSKENSEVAGAVESMADGLPALGIVAAVLGVIKTMASISEPPEVLGHLIGAALVGTFLGVLLAYGFVSPIASSIKKINTDKKMYLECIKATICAYLNGCAPAISVEYARKMIFSAARPSFEELDSLVNSLPNPQ